MDLTTAINTYGFVGLVSFGLTYISYVIYKKKTGKELSTLWKMVIQGAFAFLLLFIPVEFQNLVLEQVKAVIGIVAGTTALWQIVKAI